MRAKLQHPPRRFAAGFGPRPIEMRDYGRLELDPDEQVTFTTPRGGEYDVARKDWGFYATPSLNGRLRGFGLSGQEVPGQGPRLWNGQGRCSGCTELLGRRQQIVFAGQGRCFPGAAVRREDGVGFPIRFEHRCRRPEARW